MKKRNLVKKLGITLFTAVLFGATLFVTSNENNIPFGDSLDYETTKANASGESDGEICKYNSSYDCWVNIGYSNGDNYFFVVEYAYPGF